MTPAFCAYLFPRILRPRIACAKAPYIPAEQMAPHRACMAMLDAAIRAGFEPEGKVTLRKGKVAGTCEFIPPSSKK